MKRQLTLVALMLACLSMWADPVGREAARETAKQFLQKRGVEMTAQQPAHRAPRKGKTEKENSYYYVFNAGNDQGYVIVSGDSRTEEILGYVDHGTYCEGTVPEQRLIARVVVLHLVPFELGKAADGLGVHSLLLAVGQLVGV